MRVAVAMSGGVDSSVAALRLRDGGHEVIGITMKTWPKEDCGRSGDRACCSLEAVQYARGVAEDIGIAHYVVDFSQEFAREVRDYFFTEYSRGRTPNPCIYCNSRLKFGLLLTKARQLGMEAVATGHYARIDNADKGKVLREALDKRKDQSYFLCGIPRSELGNIIFPLGELEKEEVRKIASENGLISAFRRSSQDICFTFPGMDYREYIREKGPEGFVPGDIIDTKGRIIGKHRGVAAYTVGQRHGLGIGFHLPLYVVNIDPASNTVTVGGKENVMRSLISVKVFNWFYGPGPEPGKKYGVRIRYKGSKADAEVIGISGEEVLVRFREKQFAPTPGQAAVFYSGEVVEGAAWIESVSE